MDPLPFPADSSFTFRNLPGGDSFPLASVYMAVAYSQYIAAVVRPLVPSTPSLDMTLYLTDYSGYAGPTDLQPGLDMHGFLFPRSVTNPNYVLIWLMEGLLDHLRPFKNSIEGHSYHLTSLYQRFQVVGKVDRVYSKEVLKPLPSLDGVDISFSSQAQPLDIPDAILAAQKIFKRVTVEELEAVVPKHWRFSSGSVSFTFITPPWLRPRTMTWAELGRGAMAMIDFMRKHGEEGKFKEVRAEIQRRNAAGNFETVGLADVTVNANSGGADPPVEVPEYETA